MKSRKRIKLVDKRLFLNYAMPCLAERVRKGEITAKEFHDFCEDLAKDKEMPDEELYKLFPVAMNFIEESAKNGEKEVRVDEDVIHQYFWYDHDRVVKTRMNPDRHKYCLVLPGKVLKTKGKEAVVETPLGERKVSLAFLKGENFLGKHVTIHYYHACEIISEEDFNKLWEMKSEQGK